MPRQGRHLEHVSGVSRCGRRAEAEGLAMNEAYRVAPELTDEEKQKLRTQVVDEVAHGFDFRLDSLAFVLSSILTPAEMAAYDNWPIASVLREVFPGDTGEKLASMAYVQLGIVQRAKRKRTARAHRNMKEA